MCIIIVFAEFCQLYKASFIEPLISRYSAHGEHCTIYFQLICFHLFVYQIPSVAIATSSPGLRRPGSQYAPLIHLSSRTQVRAPAARPPPPGRPPLATYTHTLQAIMHLLLNLLQQTHRVTSNPITYRKSPIYNERQVSSGSGELRPWPGHRSWICSLNPAATDCKVTASEAKQSPQRLLQLVAMEFQTVFAISFTASFLLHSALATCKFNSNDFTIHRVLCSERKFLVQVCGKLLSVSYRMNACCREKLNSTYFTFGDVPLCYLFHFINFGLI